MSQGLVREASQALEIPDSPVGFHCLNVPSWVSNPPIEAVVFAWGASEDHQLGLDTEDNIDSPKVVESLLGLRFMGRSFAGCPLVGGSRNTLAIDADGGLWSWGWNDRGTLGHGHRELQRKPAQVEALAGVRIVQAAIGGWHCLALSDEGQVYCWGGNEYQQCGYVLTDEQEQQQQQSNNNSSSRKQHMGAASAAQTAAVNGSTLTAAGSEYVSDSASLGVLLPVRDVLVPRRCMPGLRVKQVACGGMNSVVLTETGEVWTWGEPWGEFALELQRAPRKVPGATDIAAIACGGFHNMALVADGRVLCWGTNDYGQLGNGSTIYSTTPVEVVDLEEIAISDIAAGGWHSMALGADGQIYVWGRGEYGRLGIADRTGSSKLRPHKVRGLEGHTVVQVAGGGTHSLAVTSAGRMFIWGRASYGRLGLGAGGRDCYSPVEAALPGGHERWKIAAATAGGRHTMCLAVPVRDNSSTQRNREQEIINNTNGSSRAANTAGGINNRAHNTSASVATDAVNGVSSAANSSGGRRLSSAGSGSVPAADVAGGRTTPDNIWNTGSSAAHRQQQHPQHGASAAAAEAATSDTVSSSTTLAGDGITGTDPSAAVSDSQLLRLAPPSLPPSAALPAISAAHSTHSSYSFAPSPGSSTLGQGSPSRNSLAAEVLSGSLSPLSVAARLGQPLGQGMGVEAVHAATAAAAAAAGQFGVSVRAVSPSSLGGGLPAGRPSSSPGSAAAAAATGVGSSSTILKAGQQSPMSPRALLPPMSPSQRRVGADLIENLAAAPDSEETAAVEGSATTGPQQSDIPDPLVDDGGDGDATLDEDDLMQQQEEQEQWEQDEMDREEEIRQEYTQKQKQQQQQTRHRLFRQGPSPRDSSPSTSTAVVDVGVRNSSRPGSSEGVRVQYRPASPASAAAAAAGRHSSENSPAVARGTANLSSSDPVTGAIRLRKSGSYQSLNALPSSSLSSAGYSPLASQQPHSHDAGVLHTLAAARGINSSSDSSMIPQQQQQGEALITGSLTRQQSKQLAAAIASSYSRVDASRLASAASLPSLSAGLGGGSRMGPAVTRVDSDLSHSGGFPGSHEDTMLGGNSPTGSFTGQRERGDRDGGSSPSGSSSGGSPSGFGGGQQSITGTSPPGGVYDVSLGEGMSRYATSLPEREFIHRNTHVG